MATHCTCVPSKEKKIHRAVDLGYVQRILLSRMSFLRLVVLCSSSSSVKHMLAMPAKDHVDTLQPFYSAVSACPMGKLAVVS